VEGEGSNGVIKDDHFVDIPISEHSKILNTMIGRQHTVIPTNLEVNILIIRI
jgi:hypothetical protein